LQGAAAGSVPTSAPRRHGPPEFVFTDLWIESLLELLLA
jgi:hypothetical protein